MGNYIEKDFQIENGKKIAKEALIKAGANKTGSEIIVKAGFLNKTKSKTVKQTDETYSFTFMDYAGKSHTTTSINETISNDLQKTSIKIGYEIIMNPNLDWCYINIYAQNENYSFEKLSIPKELFLNKNPENEFIHFLDTRLSIIETYIKVGENGGINEYLKQK